MSSELPPLTDSGLRIAVDARPLAFPGTGNGTYLHRMLRALARLRPDDTWILLSHRGVHGAYADLLSSPRFELAIDSGPLAKLGPLWLHLRAPRLARERRADLFWGTLGILPHRVRERLGAPILVNFHDLNAWRAPETMVRWNRWQHRLFDGAALEAADIVLCLSEATRNDIRAVFPELSPEKLEVVYPGCEIAASAEQPANWPGPARGFFLCVGTLEPRKNQRTLLAAYRAARAGGSELPPLVFAGRRGWGAEDLYQLLKSGALESEGVYYLEGLSDAGLVWCYENAGLVILPSLHEGFGLPILEAYQLGAPALVSDIPIFREIAPLAMFAPPRDEAVWRVQLIAAARELRAGRLRAPRLNRRLWSWETRAEKLAALIGAARERAATRRTPADG
jgi:glycosyltransferase involved in cell wall biosynthesis